MIIHLCIYLVMVRILLSGESWSRARSTVSGYINHQKTNLGIIKGRNIPLLMTSYHLTLLRHAI